MTEDQQLLQVLVNQPQPLIVATISGEHLSGFPSPDSDYDLRGSHVLPVSEIVGLNAVGGTIAVSATNNSWEIDLVTHDVKKFFLCYLKRMAML